MYRLSWPERRSLCITFSMSRVRLFWEEKYLLTGFKLLLDAVLY